MGKITRVILILAERNNWHLDKIMAWILENKSRPSERIFFLMREKSLLTKKSKKKNWPPTSSHITEAKQGGQQPKSKEPKKITRQRPLC